MMCNRRKGQLLSLCALIPLLASAASAADTGANRVPNTGVGLADRMDRLETRLREVETELSRLRREKQAAQQDLDRQKQDTAELKARLTQRSAASQSYPPAGTSANADKPERAAPTTEWGTRVGYQDFPYGQKNGGLYYSFFFDHLLAGQAEGIPFGDLDFEIAVGAGKSGTDHLVNFSDVLLQTAKIDYRQTMLSGWIGIKYRLNHWAPLGLRPYIIGGPGIWGDVIESPPFYIGQSRASKVIIGRKLPVVAGASLYQGGQGGGGVELNLGRTGVPILERVNIGFDYRYSAWTTGDRFGTYSFSLSASE